MALPIYSDFVSIFDFSQWEKAIQNFFCDPAQAGGTFAAPPNNDDSTRENWTTPAIPFFTGFQANVFQKQRARVSLAPVDYSEVHETRVMDASGRLNRSAWHVPLTFYIITAADYNIHTQMLATVRAVIHMMNPSVIDPNSGNFSQAAIQVTGLNPYLSTHELAQIVDNGGPTFGGHLSTDKGYFLTPIKQTATFAVRLTAWPQGILNA